MESKSRALPLWSGTLKAGIRWPTATPVEVGGAFLQASSSAAAPEPCAIAPRATHGEAKKTASIDVASFVPFCVRRLISMITST
jgi:hypothetical protein